MYFLLAALILLQPPTYPPGRLGSSRNDMRNHPQKVMDPLAYQTFENSPLLPKLRPTTHVRIAEGIHSFGQEFLGVPPDGLLEEHPFLFSEGSVAPAAPAVNPQNAATTTGGLPRFELHPKFPGLGMRMTVVRLRNGEVRAAVAGTQGYRAFRDSFATAVTDETLGVRIATKLSSLDKFALSHDTRRTAAVSNDRS